LLLPGVLTAVASAQLPEQASIRWDVPASCPRTAAADAELSARLGPEASELQPTALEVRLDERAAGKYRLVVRAESESGELERTVELSSCAEAQRAATVLIATALAPGGGLRAPPPTPGSLSRWSLRAAVLGDLRSLPGPSAGPALGVGRALGSFQLWAEARYLFARETEPLPALRASIDLYAIALGGAWLWRRGAWWAGPGLELEAGALRGQAADGQAAGSRGAPWLAAWAGALAGYTAGRVGIYLFALVGAPFLRPEFYLLDPNVVYRTEAVGARIQLGMQIALGTKKEGPAGQ
jgi:hypothetical protein